MNKMKQRMAAFLMTGVTLSTCIGGALAYDETKTQAEAEALKTMGLFMGSDQGFELSRAPSRMDALVMLLRMTGQEQTARFYEGKHPFADAPAWEPAGDYLAYAYEKGLTTGVSADQFAPDAPANAQTYVTFMLRALGYDDSSAWTQWESLGKQVGLLPAGVDTKNFLRGDVVAVSYAALSCRLKDGSMTLEEKLMKDGVFTAFTQACAELENGAPVSRDSSLALILASVYQNVSEYLKPQSMTAKEITKENMKYYLGVDTLKIEEGLAIEPLMTTAAHSVCLIRLSDGQDVEKAKSEIAKNVDPRKWICVGVDPANIRVDNIGNLVILIMDNNAPDALIKNFKALPQDAKGAVRVGDTIVEKQTIDEASVKRFAEKLNALRKTYAPENKVYFSVIPDKSYYVKDKFADYLDQDALMKQLSPLVDASITPISLNETLEIEDYYRTDLHWRQEKLDEVVAKLGKTMQFTVDWKQFSPKTSSDFIGTYRRLLDSLKPESFSYLVSPYTEASKVNIYGQSQPTTVYDSSKLGSSDPYNVFLSELSPLTVIENPKAGTQRHLVLFGDSFSTSIAPLLLEGYSKITLVDLRFMNSKLIPQHVDMKGADVLFLYSAELVNNSQLLQ